jgi:hypothetical protein
MKARTRVGRQELNTAPGRLIHVPNVVLVTLLFALLTGCGGAGTEWDDPWFDSNGHAAPEGVITSYRGPEHCDWESSVFLIVGWPLGTSTRTSERMYVRDPDGLFTKYLSSEFRDDVDLPPQAHFTGYSRNGAQLWLDSSGADEYVFVVRGDEVERWPRAKQLIACA